MIIIIIIIIIQRYITFIVKYKWELIRSNNTLILVRSFCSSSSWKGKLPPSIVYSTTPTAQRSTGLP